MKRRALLVFVLTTVLGFVVGAAGQDRLKFSAPVLTDQGATDFAVSRITFDLEHQRIDIWLREVKADGSFKFAASLTEPQGKEVHVEYFGAEAMSLMAAMNKMDFRTISLQQRIMQQLLKDGKIPAATIGG